MAYKSAEKRRVYLACKAIFAGSNALLRKQKKIRELVGKHKTSLKPLLNDFGHDKVVDILKVMLEAQIFQSELKAKVEFPELFVSSPVRSLQRTASENDAVRSVEEALDEITNMEERDHPADEDVELKERFPEVVEVNGDNVAVEYPPEGFPSLYPSYLPYKTQHLILNTAQRILEEGCFEFAGKWLPSVLETRGWDCPEAGELTKWTRTLANRAEELPPHALKLSGSSLNEALFATNRLRHSAVHRLPTTARGVDQLVRSAISMAEALQDTVRAAQLEDLHCEIESKIKAMEFSKNVLEDNLSNELREIARQREELDRKEKELVATMLREDADNKSLIGDLLAESVQKVLCQSNKGVSREDQEETRHEVDGKNGCGEGWSSGGEEDGVKESTSGDDNSDGVESIDCNTCVD